MPNYTRYEQRTTKVVFEVKGTYDGTSYSANHAELLRAIHAARVELNPENPGNVADDVIKVTPADESILVWYEKGKVLSR